MGEGGHRWAKGGHSRWAGGKFFLDCTKVVLKPMLLLGFGFLENLWSRQKLFLPLLAGSLLVLLFKEKMHPLKALKPFHL